MGIERIFDFNEIVSVPRELTFREQVMPALEQYIPTFLGLARRFGYVQPIPEPIIERREYPAEMTVRMPAVPWDNGGQAHPLLYFFERTKEVADRVQFGDQAKKLKLRLDERSFNHVIDVPFHGDGTFGGDTMFHTFALFEYSLQWFGSRGYHITSAGVSTDHEFSLELRPA